MPEPVPKSRARPVEVTVAIPVRDGSPLLARTLVALAEQTVAHELLVCDSGSRDGSVALAREHGARVIEIAPERFSHGGTRNLLMREATGAHVAFLTQDAEPSDERWLERLLSGFALVPEVGLVYGSFRPRPDAPPAARLELERWFASLSPDGVPRIDRLAPDERPVLIELIGPRGFCTDTNACLARGAWERAPFREVAYAEDRALAIDMLKAGYAKAYVPEAAVFHSHSYTLAQELKRCFDEWRGLLEVYGFREPAAPGHLVRRFRGELGAARRQLRREGASPRVRCRALAAVAARQPFRISGALLGSRADRLPARARQALSLERRASFRPLRPVPDERGGGSPTTSIPEQTP